MAYYENGPRMPYCPPDELQRLRDLWRPDVQANYRSCLEREAGEIVVRPDNYDTTATSLSAEDRMFVVPPAIAEPITEELKDHATDESYFQVFHEDIPSATIRGAIQFMRRFNAASYLNPNMPYQRGLHVDSSFDNKGRPLQGHEEDKVHKVSIPAPLLERGVTHRIVEVRRLIAGLDDDYGALAFFGDPRMERQSREGIFGWTIPQSLKTPFKWASSLILVKNHLVRASWYMGPPELLSLGFLHPQLSKKGEERVAQLIADNEHLLPPGTDYNDIYSYHDMQSESESYAWRGTWKNTDEDREKSRAAIERERRASSLFYARSDFY